MRRCTTSRRPGQRGRLRQVGARQPVLRQRLADPATAWVGLPVPWYDGTVQSLAVATGVALWYRSGQTPVRLRWRPCATRPDFVQSGA